MKPPVENVRVGRRGRDQLIKLRRAAGIEQWNIWCRWALCASLREAAVPPPVEGESDGGVEIPWRVFAGEYSDVYVAMLGVRWRRDVAKAPGLDPAEHFRRHLHRGLSALEAKLELHDEGRDMLPSLALGKRRN